jgi:mycofactocin precursor
MSSRTRPQAPARSAHSHPHGRQEQPMAPTSETQPAPEEPVVEETLVEEVSIDGMCGVY